jgi:hypothetical protein
MSFTLAESSRPGNSPLHASSGEPGDSVFLGRARVGLRTEGTGKVRIRELPEEPFESGGRGENQEAPRARDGPPLSVRDTTGCEHEPTGAGLEFRFADLEHVLSFEHVEQLVLVLVNVERRVDGFVLLKDRERSTGRVGGGFD